METTRNRTLIISALVASLGPLVGNGLWAGTTGDGEAIRAEFRDLPTEAYLALSLELAGFIGMTVLFACLVVRTYAVLPVAAVTAAISAASMLAVKLGSLGPMMALHADPDDVDPGLAETLITLNDMAFIVSGLLFCLAMCAVGVGLLKTELPKFLGWSAAVLGGLGVVAGIVGVTEPDAYVPIPFVLLLVWMIALAITTAMRPEARSENPANLTYSDMAPTE